MLAISIASCERERAMWKKLSMLLPPCLVNLIILFGGIAWWLPAPLWSRFGSIFIRFLLRDPGNSAGHVMLDNVFAVDHRWDTVLALRWFMRENGVKNQPRCSWISIDGIVHQFHVGSHTQIERIY